MQVLAARVPAWKLPAPSYVSVVLFDGPRSAEAPEEPGDISAPARSAPCPRRRGRRGLGIRREDGEERSHPPASPPLHLIDLARELGVRGPVRRRRAPSPAPRGSTGAPDAGGEVLRGRRRGRGNVRPRASVKTLAERTSSSPSGLAVGRGGVLLVAARVADVAVQDEETWGALRRAEISESGVLDCDRGRCVAHSQDVPPYAKNGRATSSVKAKARLPFDVIWLFRRPSTGRPDPGDRPERLLPTRRPPSSNRPRIPA